MAWGRADPRPALAARLRDDHRVSEVVLCGSGTQALSLALEAAERLVGEPRPVALPAYACFDVASAALRFGRPVRFYDLDPSTLGPDLASLAGAVASGVGSVVLASLFGVPLDWTALDRVLGGVVVIEDAAQGHGGRWGGARLGGHGRLGVLSFARGKGWTGGAGGALLVRDALDVPAAARPLPEAGELPILIRAGAHRSLGSPWTYRVPRSLPGLGLGETRFHPAREPTAMARSSAALLLDSRDAAEAEGRLRRRAALEYRLELERGGRVGVIAVSAGGEAGYVRYPVLIGGGIGSLTNPARALALGAAPSYPIPLPRLAGMEVLAPEDARGSWPGAATLAQDLATLPTHGLVRPDERRALIVLLHGAPDGSGKRG